MAWVRTPIALFLVAVLAIGGVAVAAMAMRGAIRGSEALVTEEALALGEVERLRGLRERVSRKARTFLLVGDERFLRELRESESDFSDGLANLRARARQSEERELLQQLEEHERARRVVTEQLITVRRSVASIDSLARAHDRDLQPLLDALDTAIRKLVDYHRREVDQARAAASDEFSRATLFLLVAASVALVVAGLTSLVLARTLRRIEGRANRLLRERDRFFDLSIDMVCVAGTDGYFKQLNPAFEATLGYTRAELLEKPFLDFVHADDREATLKEVEKLSTGQPTIDFENRYTCKDGRFKWLSWHASAAPGGSIYAVARDITERKANQEKLEALTEELRVMAVVDELTGIHNRRGFNILAEQQLKQATRKRQKVVFFFADLDGLKRINDELGHDVGDRAIREAAIVLATAFRKSDIVARLGGDEFVVLATDGAGDEIEVLLTNRLYETVRQFNSKEPRLPFTLAMSIGSTIFDPEQPSTIDAILKSADEMMYAQKARRKEAAAASVPEQRSPLANGGTKVSSP
jgi:diguanylate cyclase (GGDEF)-like protein/PAS domain S-box-containing protein